MTEPYTREELEKLAAILDKAVPTGHDGQRLLAKARAGLADRERLDWLLKHCVIECGYRTFQNREQIDASRGVHPAGTAVEADQIVFSRNEDNEMVGGVASSAAAAAAKEAACGHCEHPESKHLASGLGGCTDRDELNYACECTAFVAPIAGPFPVGDGGLPCAACSTYERCARHESRVQVGLRSEIWPSGVHTPAPTRENIDAKRWRAIADYLVGMKWRDLPGSEPASFADKMLADKYVTRDGINAFADGLIAGSPTSAHQVPGLEETR